MMALLQKLILIYYYSYLATAVAVRSTESVVVLGLGNNDNSTLEEDEQEEEAAATVQLRRKMQPNTQGMMKIKVIGSDPKPSQLPLGLCVGDCDSDSQCKPPLICFQRTRFEAVPGCEGGERDGSYSDYCISDVETRTTTPPETSPPKPPPPRVSGFPDIQFVGNDNVFDHGTTYPLGHCMGDCDDDRKDCRPPLVCYQRENPNQPVFGCRGGLYDNSQYDYCIFPDNSVIPPEERPPLPYTSPQPFRLKLYWEEGYRWQGESKERKFCMMYNYRGKECWHGLERVNCDQDQIYIAHCQRDEPRQQFSFVYLEDRLRRDNPEILIQLGSGHNSCFQRTGRHIVLRRCDPTSKLQRWYSPPSTQNGGDGDLHGYRFELSPWYVPGLCITTLHHPKNGERVELYSCKRSRSRYHQSSIWNVY